MGSPKIEVKCTVDSCHYNHNERCHASALEVNTLNNSQAETSSETNCSTFKPDESNFT